MNRKKPKKSKKRPPQELALEGCGLCGPMTEARIGALDAVFHLRLIQGGGHIVELYKQYFPTEYRERGIDYTSARSLLASYDSFTQLVDKYLFPVWDFSDLGALYEDPGYCLETMALCVYNNYHWWDRMQNLEELPLFEKLIVNAHGESAPFDDIDFVLPRQGFVFDWGLLGEACAREKGALALLPRAAEAVLGQTGNFWFDMTEEEYYQGEAPPWDETNMHYFTAEWIQAKEMRKDVERFYSWVGCNYTRIEKVKRLLRKAWRPMEQKARVRTHSGRPLIDTLGGVF
jgi:hypothetical protein